jgi:hypothetical protein
MILTDNDDNFFASLCKWTNNTVVHGDGTIAENGYRSWNPITITINIDSSSFTMEQMRLNVRSSIILEESYDHGHES